MARVPAKSATPPVRLAGAVRYLIDADCIVRIAERVRGYRADMTFADMVLLIREMHPRVRLPRV